MTSIAYIASMVSRQLLIHNHEMERSKFEIRVLLKHYKIIKLLPRFKEYVKWKEKASLVSVWHSDGSNVSTLEKKTLKIYHVLEDLNYGIGLFRKYVEFWKKIRKKVFVGCQMNLVHQKIPSITRLRHFED